MNDTHEQFGRYGAWLNPALGDHPRIEYAPQLEELGYQTIWVGIGADPVGDMNLLEQMIAATQHAIIASAIINKREKHWAAALFWRPSTRWC